MAYILFWFSFGCSPNHIFLTLVASNQFLNQLRIHDYSPINRLSMICSRDRHSRLIAKILHLILLVNNWHNGSKSISIPWPHLFDNPPFIGVLNVKDFICYLCQCYSNIRHLCLVYLCISYMVDFKNFYQDMFIYYFCSSPNITLILLCLGSNFQLFKNSTKMLWRSVFHSISNRPTNPTLIS
jgi:hypothetical protein